jgi:ribosomal 50S subunit-recycling heat shock protein
MARAESLALVLLWVTVATGAARHGAGRRVQLHRALSKLGLCSRSVAWQAIKQGRVQVNGETVHDPLLWVDVQGDGVTMDRGRRLRKDSACRVWMVNKPVRMVVARCDDRGRKTGPVERNPCHVMQARKAFCERLHNARPAVQQMPCSVFPVQGDEQRARQRPSPLSAPKTTGTPELRDAQ